MFHTSVYPFMDECWFNEMCVMYVCMYVCMYVRVCIFMYLRVCMYVHTYVYVCVCVFYVYVRVYVCMYVRMCVCMYVWIYTCMYYVCVSFSLRIVSYPSLRSTLLGPNTRAFLSLLILVTL
jgi:hypothetical protein